MVWYALPKRRPVFETHDVTTKESIEKSPSKGYYCISPYLPLPSYRFTRPLFLTSKNGPVKAEYSSEDCSFALKMGAAGPSETLLVATSHKTVTLVARFA
jgi:hypothetical protein